MNNLRSIHETELTNILNIINNGINTVGNITTTNNSSQFSSTSSIAKAAAGLTLTYPVIVSSSIKPSTAQMCSKMVERSAVSMLRMLFAANSLSNASDAYSHISRFHTNLDFDKIGLDDFLDITNTLSEGAISNPYGIEDIGMIAKINEDCRRNLDYYLEDDVNEDGMVSYKITNIGNTMKIIKEDKLARDMMKQKQKPGSSTKYNTNDPHEAQRRREHAADYKQKQDNYNRQQSNWEKEQEYKQKQDDLNRQYKQDRDDVQDRLSIMKMDMDNIPRQLLTSDVKKANELVPSLMVINFYTAYDDSGKDIRYAQQAVIGIKAKMIGVMSQDIITKIITKTNDSRLFLNLVKASTREISFIKDLFLGIDQAKLDALSKKRRGSSNELFKALERRSLNGKIRKAFGKENIHRAISSIVISQEEVELLKKYNDIDVEDPNIVNKFMEVMNLLYFIIVDETSEVAKIMVDDGSKRFEELTFNAMEKETDDKTSKQVLNLMTKMR